MQTDAFVKISRPLFVQSNTVWIKLLLKFEKWCVNCASMDCMLATVNWEATFGYSMCTLMSVGAQNFKMVPDILRRI